MGEVIELRTRHNATDVSVPDSLLSSQPHETVSL